jgi:hypothetical protein
MTDVIVFIDALSPDELSGVLAKMYTGDIDAGTPRVTPSVMSKVYTGLSDAETGILAQCSYTANGSIKRPAQSTFIDQLSRQDRDVVTMSMPFCVPFHVGIEDLANGAGEVNSILHGTDLQESFCVPESGAPSVQTNATAVDARTDHPDDSYASINDMVTIKFAKFRELIRNAEPSVAIIGIQSVDKYCHFNHLEERGGKTYREHLIDGIAEAVKSVWGMIDGDVLFFSDHGQTELEQSFYVNRWLSQNGWLEYEVDQDLMELHNAVLRGEGEKILTDKIEGVIESNRESVTVSDESEVIASDPYDSQLTLLKDRDSVDTERLRQELLDTGMYRSVNFKWELFDKNAEYYEQTPDIIPDRKEGVFVTGSLHREPIGFGYYRSGVHHWRGCFGATCELNLPENADGRGDSMTPIQLHDVITDFIDLEVTAPDIPTDAYTDEEIELLKEQL